MQINSQVKSIYTHEGAKAKHINPELQLYRSVMANLLWEDQFYEEGVKIAERIKALIPLVDHRKVAGLAIYAREEMKLRHVPLLLARELARISSGKYLVSSLLERIIQRPDELTEFLAIYWQDGKQPLSGQVKKGLAKAFTKFSAYQLAKYNRDKAIKLKDVLFLCHAKPKDAEQEAVWKSLIDGTIATPDTWEVSLSAGADKKETWERLILEKKLGGLALLRNLRNMYAVGVDQQIIFSALAEMKTERILPYRFIAAAKAVPQWEDKIEIPMLKCLEGRAKFKGNTAILVDVSGSMEDRLSSKSDLTRLDAACGLAILARELCENVAIITFSSGVVTVPPRRGFALRDAIFNSQVHSSTYLGRPINAIQKEPYDRLIIITDEQSHDSVPAPRKGSKAYIINVASYANGVGYGDYIHVDGWSEAVLDYIQELEKFELKLQDEQ